MTCPKGHKADVDRGEGSERIIWCAWCGWRMVVRIVKNSQARYNHKRKQERRKLKAYALDALRAKHRGGEDEFI